MISGGIKFFSLNKNLLSLGASITATSGGTTKDYALDKNPLTYWRSVGSNDATTETLVVTLPLATINRVLLVDHNFKGFNVQYWNGAAFVHFTGVVGMSGAMANITETAFAKDTAYYEVNAVTTTQIRIQVTTTQVVNAEKYLSQIITTSELGTLTGYPKITSPKLSRNERSREMLSGKVTVVKGIESFEVGLNFDNYPGLLSTDLNLMFSLFDREEPFLLWLCGGRSGSDYFRYQLRGWRLKDIFAMGITSDYAVNYLRNTYTNPVDLSFKMKEHV